MQQRQLLRARRALCLESALRPDLRLGDVQMCVEPLDLDYVALVDVIVVDIIAIVSKLVANP